MHRVQVLNQEREQLCSLALEGHVEMSGGILAVTTGEEVTTSA